MSVKFQSHLDLPPHYVYHCGLIKILVQYHLSQSKCYWDSFLTNEGLKEITLQKKRGHPSKSKESLVKETCIVGKSSVIQSYGKTKPSLEESSPSGKVMRSRLRKQVVEPGEITYVRKIKHTKASGPQTLAMDESPRVPQ